MGPSQLVGISSWRSQNSARQSDVECTRPTSFRYLTLCPVHVPFYACPGGLCSLKHVDPATSDWQRGFMCQALSTAVFTLSSQRCLTWYHLPSLTHHCLPDRAPSPLSSSVPCPALATPHRWPFLQLGQHILGCRLVVHHVNVPLVLPRRSALGLIKRCMTV